MHSVAPKYYSCEIVEDFSHIIAFLNSASNKRAQNIKKNQQWSKHIHVLGWTSQSPEGNSIKNLWSDFKIAKHCHAPFDVMENELFCKEWENKTDSRCAKLVEIYHKGSVIAVKGGSANYWVRGKNTKAYHIFRCFFFVWKMKKKNFYFNFVCFTFCWSISYGNLEIYWNLWMESDKSLKKKAKLLQ